MAVLVDRFRWPLEVPLEVAVLKRRFGWLAGWAIWRGWVHSQSEIRIHFYLAV